MALGWSPRGSYSETILKGRSADMAGRYCTTQLFSAAADNLCMVCVGDAAAAGSTGGNDPARGAPTTTA
ncbi:MAG TPA: hypothetical protein VHB97_04970, partial [Polyangia bacterium]|nr:hypothetical protein [Polyangia bacterium]